MENNQSGLGIIFLAIAVCLLIVTYLVSKDEPQPHGDTLDGRTINSETRIINSEISPSGKSDLISRKKGMSWGIYPNAEMRAKGLTLASCHGQPTTEIPDCNAYRGDTSCQVYQPILCIMKTNSPKPDFLPFDRYAQWASGEIKLTEAIRGTDITSPERGNQFCSQRFGPDWRMAEFHDGWGWGFWANGNIDPITRFWVAINDQPANCWDGQ